MNREQIKTELFLWPLLVERTVFFHLFLWKQTTEKNQTANFIWARKESKHCLCLEMAQFGAVTCGSQKVFLFVSFGFGRGQAFRVASMRFEVVIHSVFYVPKLLWRRNESKVSFVLLSLLSSSFWLLLKLSKTFWCLCVLERNGAAPLHVKIVWFCFYFVRLCLRCVIRSSRTMSKWTFINIQTNHKLPKIIAILPFRDFVDSVICVCFASEKKSTQTSEFRCDFT